MTAFGSVNISGTLSGHSRCPAMKLFKLRPRAVDGGDDVVADDAAHDVALNAGVGLPAERTIAP